MMDVEYKGIIEWDAYKNDPPLSDGNDLNGFWVAVIESGTQNLGSGAIAFMKGEVLMHLDGRWQKVIHESGDAKIYRIETKIEELEKRIFELEKK